MEFKFGDLTPREMRSVRIKLFLVGATIVATVAMLVIVFPEIFNFKTIFQIILKLLR